MHLEVLVEEPSAEAALRELLPRILGPEVAFRILPHQGKQDLLEKLPNKLRGYRHWLPEDWRIVVLIDEDRQDCKELKGRLESEAKRAGFSTRSSPAARRDFQVLNRLAVEELEAWFFGDPEALRSAYPGIPASLEYKAKYRDPDAVAGGTWEALERVLKQAGYFPAGLAKIETARSVARHMDPERNRSKSFQVFRDGLRALAAG